MKCALYREYSGYDLSFVCGTEVDKRSRMYKAVKSMAILQKWCVRTVPSLEDGQQEYWQKMEKR